MKINISFLIFIFFTIQGLHSQTLNCKINGILLEQSPFKYALLNDAKTKKVIFAPIIDGHFEFNIERQNEFQMMTLFLGEDSLKTYEQSRRDKGNSRFIAVEDTYITIKDNVLGATVKGGSMNKDIDDMYKVMSSGQFESFFQQHPNSPVSLVLLKSLIRINEVTWLQGTLNCKLFYNKLSENLKNSILGKELLTKMSL